MRGKSRNWEGARLSALTKGRGFFLTPRPSAANAATKGARVIPPRSTAGGKVEVIIRPTAFASAAGWDRPSPRGYGPAGQPSLRSYGAARKPRSEKSWRRTAALSQGGSPAIRHPFHEPDGQPQFFGSARTCPRFVSTRRVASRKAATCRRTPRRCRGNWFMVPMHAKGRKEALHEPGDIEHRTSNIQ